MLNLIGWNTKADSCVNCLTACPDAQPPSVPSSSSLQGSLDLLSAPVMSVWIWIHLQTHSSHLNRITFLTCPLYQKSAYCSAHLWLLTTMRQIFRFEQFDYVTGHLCQYKHKEMFVRTSGFMERFCEDMVMHDCVPSVLAEHRMAINRLTGVDWLGESLPLTVNPWPQSIPLQSSICLCLSLVFPQIQRQL